MHDELEINLINSWARKRKKVEGKSILDENLKKTFRRNYSKKEEKQQNEHTRLEYEKKVKKNPSLLLECDIIIMRV